MKNLLAICLIVAAPFSTTTWAGGNPTSMLPAAASAPTASVVTGEVLEIKDVDSYTYLRLKTKDGETWAAVNTVTLKKGAKVTIENVMVMKDFESKALKKTFPSIIFGNLAGAAKDGATPHGNAAAPVADTTPIKVAKATGANARTVAEIVTKATELKDKPVKVSGKVVKYNPEVMGKNWVHLRDGSGAATDNSNDVLVTTKDQVKVGDVVTVTGVVRTDKDFGSGYAYKVLIEDAKVQ